MDSRGPQTAADQPRCYPSPIEPVDVADADLGIRAVVRELRLHGIATYESCEGGPGHSSPQPYVKFAGNAAEAHFAAGVALNLGLRPFRLSQFWWLVDGHMDGPNWELTFYPPEANRGPWTWPNGSGNG